VLTTDDLYQRWLDELCRIDRDSDPTILAGLEVLGEHYGHDFPGKLDQCVLLADDPEIKILEASRLQKGQSVEFTMHGRDLVGRAMDWMRNPLDRQDPLVQVECHGTTTFLPQSELTPAGPESGDTFDGDGDMVVDVVMVGEKSGVTASGLSRQQQHRVLNEWISSLEERAARLEEFEFPDEPAGMCASISQAHELKLLELDRDLLASRVLKRFLEDGLLASSGRLLGLVAARRPNMPALDPDFEALHPRGKDGKFIEKFSFVNWFDRGGNKRRGQVTGIDKRGGGRYHMIVQPLDQRGNNLGKPEYRRPDELSQAKKTKADLDLLRRGEMPGPLRPRARVPGGAVRQSADERIEGINQLLKRDDLSDERRRKLITEAFQLNADNPEFDDRLPAADTDIWGDENPADFSPADRRRLEAEGMGEDIWGDKTPDGGSELTPEQLDELERIFNDAAGVEMSEAVDEVPDAFADVPGTDEPDIPRSELEREPAELSPEMQGRLDEWLADRDAVEGMAEEQFGLEEDYFGDWDDYNPGPGEIDNDTEVRDGFDDEANQKLAEDAAEADPEEAAQFVNTMSMKEMHRALTHNWVTQGQFNAWNEARIADITNKKGMRRKGWSQKSQATGLYPEWEVPLTKAQLEGVDREIEAWRAEKVGRGEQDPFERQSDIMDRLGEIEDANPGVVNKEVIELWAEDRKLKKELDDLIQREVINQKLPPKPEPKPAVGQEEITPERMAEIQDLLDNYNEQGISPERMREIEDLLANYQEPREPAPDVPAPTDAGRMVEQPFETPARDLDQANAAGVDRARDALAAWQEDADQVFDARVPDDIADGYRRDMEEMGLLLSDYIEKMEAGDYEQAQSALFEAIDLRDKMKADLGRNGIGESQAEGLRLHSDWLEAEQDRLDPIVAELPDLRAGPDGGDAPRIARADEALAAWQEDADQVFDARVPEDIQDDFRRRFEEIAESIQAYSDSMREGDPENAQSALFEAIDSRDKLRAELERNGIGESQAEGLRLHSDWFEEEQARLDPIVEALPDLREPGPVPAVPEGEVPGPELEPPGPELEPEAPEVPEPAEELDPLARAQAARDTWANPVIDTTSDVKEDYEGIDDAELALSNGLDTYARALEGEDQEAALEALLEARDSRDQLTAIGQEVQDVIDADDTQGSDYRWNAPELAELDWIDEEISRLGGEGGGLEETASPEDQPMSLRDWNDNKIDPDVDPEGARAQSAEQLRRLEVQLAETQARVDELDARPQPQGIARKMLWKQKQSANNKLKAQQFYLNQHREYDESLRGGEGGEAPEVPEAAGQGLRDDVELDRLKEIQAEVQAEYDEIGRQDRGSRQPTPHLGEARATLGRDLQFLREEIGTREGREPSPLRVPEPSDRFREKYADVFGDVDVPEAPGGGRTFPEGTGYGGGQGEFLLQQHTGQLARHDWDGQWFGQEVDGVPIIEYNDPDGTIYDIVPDGDGGWNVTSHDGDTAEPIDTWHMDRDVREPWEYFKYDILGDPGRPLDRRRSNPEIATVLDVPADTSYSDMVKNYRDKIQGGDTAAASALRSKLVGEQWKPLDEIREQNLDLNDGDGAWDGELVKGRNGKFLAYAVPREGGLADGELETFDDEAEARAWLEDRLADRRAPWLKGLESTPGLFDDVPDEPAPDDEPGGSSPFDTSVTFYDKIAPALNRFDDWGDVAVVLPDEGESPYLTVDGDGWVPVFMDRNVDPDTGEINYRVTIRQNPDGTPIFDEGVGSWSFQDPDSAVGRIRSLNNRSSVVPGNSDTDIKRRARNRPSRERVTGQVQEQEWYGDLVSGIEERQFSGTFTPVGQMLRYSNGGNSGAIYQSGGKWWVVSEMGEYRDPAGYKTLGDALDDLDERVPGNDNELVDGGTWGRLPRDLQPLRVPGEPGGEVPGNEPAPEAPEAPPAPEAPRAPEVPEAPAAPEAPEAPETPEAPAARGRGWLTPETPAPARGEEAPETPAPPEPPEASPPEYDAPQSVFDQYGIDPGDARDIPVVPQAPADDGRVAFVPDGQPSQFTDAPAFFYFDPATGQYETYDRLGKAVNTHDNYAAAMREARNLGWGGSGRWDARAPDELERTAATRQQVLDGIDARNAAPESNGLWKPWHATENRIMYHDYATRVEYRPKGGYGTYIGTVYQNENGTWFGSWSNKGGHGEQKRSIKTFDNPEDAYDHVETGTHAAVDKDVGRKAARQAARPAARTPAAPSEPGIRPRKGRVPDQPPDPNAEPIALDEGEIGVRTAPKPDIDYSQATQYGVPWDTGALGVVKSARHGFVVHSRKTVLNETAKQVNRRRGVKAATDAWFEQVIGEMSDQWDAAGIRIPGLMTGIPLYDQAASKRGGNYHRKGGAAWTDFDQDQRDYHSTVGISLTSNPNPKGTYSNQEEYDRLVTTSHEVAHAVDNALSAKVKLEQGQEVDRVEGVIGGMLGSPDPQFGLSWRKMSTDYIQSDEEWVNSLRAIVDEHIDDPLAKDFYYAWLDSDAPLTLRHEGHKLQYLMHPPEIWARTMPQLLQRRLMQRGRERQARNIEMAIRGEKTKGVTDGKLGGYLAVGAHLDPNAPGTDRVLDAYEAILDRHGLLDNTEPGTATEAVAEAVGAPA